MVKCFYEIDLNYFVTISEVMVLETWKFYQILSIFYYKLDNISKNYFSTFKLIELRNDIKVYLDVFIKIKSIHFLITYSFFILLLVGQMVVYLVCNNDEIPLVSSYMKIDAMNYF